MRMTNDRSRALKAVRLAGADVARLITDVGQLRLIPDQVSRVVIDERTGTIVMDDNVRNSTVAISQGNLTVRITETLQVSQPEPFSQQGDTAVVPRTDVNVTERGTGNIGIVVVGGIADAVYADIVKLQGGVK
jgi:flagellar P-ring protein precursor FlgI